MVFTNNDVYVYMYTCMDVIGWLDECMCVCIYMHVCMYTCMYVYIYKWCSPKIRGGVTLRSQKCRGVPRQFGTRGGLIPHPHPRTILELKHNNYFNSGGV